ncbi:MAG: hypothetical protein EA379_04750 [Phycisphaerales bacterium]|nr:MAG: hypothetical protein EA379_04750 [Phycisphaerales bacterium]
MNTTNNARRLCRLAAVGGLAAFLAISVGCHDSKREDIPAGAQPLPLGSSVREFNHRQAQKARADAFVFYRYEWDRETAELTEWGARHLNRVLSAMHREHHPIVIEPAPDASLNEARRRTIIAALARHDVDYPERRVVIAYPGALDMTGDDAILQFDKYIQDSAGRGAGTGGGIR